MLARRIAAGVIFCGALFAFQKPFRQYPGIEYDNFPLPKDWNEKTEFVFTRLMYPPGPRGGFRGYQSADWAHGGTMWTQDYPRADRHFSEAVRRLTRIHIRSVEQPVNLDDGDDVYNFPFIYSVQPGRSTLTPSQADKMRDYLLRGGFYMTDDYWGEPDRAVFEGWMHRVFPDRQVVELDDKDSIFHTIYDLDDRYQVPGARYLQTGVTWKCEGCPPRWYGVFDDKGRLMVAAVFNSDVGDSWEWADDPHYLEKFSALGIRIGVNYIVYSMTH